MAPSAGSPLNNLLNLILDGLFVAEKRRLEESVDRLNRNHNEIRGSVDDGFLLSGTYYRPRGNPGPAPAKKAPLDNRILSEGMAFLKDAAKVDLERQLIKQSLSHLLIPCRSEQDIRDALPDCLSALMPRSIQALPRTNEEAWTIRNDERALRQYRKALPRIEFYSAARLIY